jgi:hypothetical protein
MLNKRRKLIAALPFIAVCVIMLYTWIEFATNMYLPTWRQYLALALVIVNVVVYFVRFRQAILLTGIILALATVNLLCFFAIIQTSWITIGSVSTPGIQLWSLLILGGWFAVNYSNLINWYLDFQEARKKKRPN